MYLKITVLIYFLAILGCNTKKNTYNRFLSDDVASIKITLLDTLTLESRYGSLQDVGRFLSSPLTLDKEDNIYLLEDLGNMQHRLSGFSQKGDLKWAISNQGEGPGELGWTSGIAVSHDSLLYLANDSRIDVFSLEGEFKKRQQFLQIMSTSALSRSIEAEKDDIPKILGICACLIGFTNDGDLVFASGLRGKIGAEIIILDVSKEQWEVRNRFSVVEQNILDIGSQIAIAPPVSIIGEYIVIGSNTEYVYHWYKPSGELSHIIIHSEVRFSPPALTNKFKKGLYGERKREFSHMQPLILAGDFYIGGAEWPKKYIDPALSSRNLESWKPTKHELFHSLDIFDRDTYELIASLDPHEYDIRRVLGSDSHGYIYAELLDEELSIGRFELEVILNRESF